MIYFAQYGLIIILSLLLFLHILIFLKIIPYSIVWGNRLKSDKEMYRFETLSILASLFFLIIVLIQANILSFNLPDIFLTISFWIMSVVFAFNTVGNILSENKLERILFTPITIIMVILSLTLALTN